MWAHASVMEQDIFELEDGADRGSKKGEDWRI
jgi:hypothetical protein